MKRISGKPAAAFLQRRSEDDRAAAQRHALAQASYDADDRRYADGSSRWHRFLLRTFPRHFALFAKAVVASGAERGMLNLVQAKALARSIDQRLSQEGD